MKNRKLRVAPLILAIMMALSAFALPASAASNWTWRQTKAHDAADLFRELGYGENTAGVKAAQDYFAGESGENVSGSYYYSARTGQYYYLYDNNINSTYYDNSYSSGSGLVYDNDGGIWDGQYTWYWDSSVVSFYRWQNYNKVWISNGYAIYNNGYTWYYDSTQGNFYRWQNNAKVWNSNYTGAGYTGGTSYGNNNYTYTNTSNKNFYSGVISGVNVDNSAATCLAKMMSSSTHGVWSQTTQAAIGWVTLYNLGVNGLTDANLANTFGWYNRNATTTDDYGRDMLALAKDVIYRYQCWQSGQSNVGQVIPNSYNWLYRYSNTTVACRTSQDGADYTFPDMWNNSSAYRTPYTT